MPETNLLQGIKVKKLISETIKLEPKRIALKLPESIDLVLEEAERGREIYAVVMVVREKSEYAQYTLFSSKILEEAERKYLEYSALIKSSTDYPLTYNVAAKRFEVNEKKTA
jgi:hypothetical protein